MLVLDLRHAPLSELVELRISPAFGEMPCLIVSSGPVSEAEIALLAADDTVTLGSADDGAAKTLQRRLTILCEVARLRLSLSFAQQALEQSVNGLSIVDTEQRDAPLVHVSPVLTRMTGYAPAEMLGINCRFLQGTERQQPAIAEIRQALVERSRTSALLRNYRKDGTAFWNELTVFPLLAHGRVTPWMGGVQHDVTEIVEARAEIDALCQTLAHQQRFDHAILDGLEVGIVTADDAGQITFINRSAARLLELGQDVTGFEARAVLGLAQAPRDILAGQSRRTIGYPLVTGEGAELDLDLSISRGDAWVDDRVGFFFIFRDVREEKHRDAERARFQRLVAMGTMVAGFAHEVRNPVAALRSIAEELVEELRDAGLGFPHVGLMLQMVERIERLVRTSLQFGRPAAPKRAPQRPSVIVTSALDELRPRLRALGGDIVVEIEPDLPDVDVDEKQVAQALVILLNNALDATGQPSRVLARVRRAPSPDLRQRKSEPPLPSAVRFEIIDDGAGIPQDIRERIFDPFFTTKPSGTGLGLSIAQQIVSENGARLEVSSVGVSVPGGPAARTSFAIVVGPM